MNFFADKRFIDHSQRVVNPPKPSVQVSDDNKSTGGKKPKNKAYRRTDSSASGGSRSRSATKELALPPDDSLMCPPSFVTGLKPGKNTYIYRHYNCCNMKIVYVNT